MSKQSDAKEHQEYRDYPKCCGNCENFTSDMVTPKWMIGTKYKDDDSCKIEKNLRCSVGGFKVKKLGFCEIYFAKDFK